MVVKTMTFFRQNLRAHKKLDKLFLVHQTALLDMDLRRAARGFSEYERELLRHMRLEEKKLIPIYTRGGEERDAPAVFFTGEHKRMREFLKRIGGRLRRLARSRSRGQAVALFDLEAAYKALVHHHDLREKFALYPARDRSATPEEKKTLLVR